MPVVRTDTLYFLDAPHMAGLLPVDGETVRTSIPSDLDNAAGTYVAPSWTLPLPALTALDMKLRLWIDVQGVVTNPPRGVNCFWAFDLKVEHADGTVTPQSSHCRSEEAVLPTGVQLYEFSIKESIEAVTVGPGDRLTITMDTYAARAPEATLDLLSGTVDHDSSWTIQDLQLPIDTKTLL